MYVKSFLKGLLGYQNIHIYNFLLLSLLLFVLKIPFFQQLNLLFVDQLHGSIKPRPEILVVGIDDTSLQQIGSWPWDRKVFADFISALQDAKPKVLGIDLLFLEARPGDSLLEEALSEASFPVIIGSKYEKNAFYPPEFSALSGYVNVLTDSDGKIRRTNSNLKISGMCIPSFTYKIYQEWGTNLTVDRACSTDTLLFNYAEQPFTTVSFVDVYSKRVDPSILKNKIILVGTTAKDLKSDLNDNFIDVFGNLTPGIYIHANILNSYLNNQFQTEMPFYGFYVFIVAFSSLLLLIYKKFSSILAHLLVLLIALALCNILGIVLFELGFNWPFVNTNVLLIASNILAVMYKYSGERQSKDFIQKAFTYYSNADLVKKLTDDPDHLRLGGEKRLMTVFFTDIRNFTALSERLAPERLIHFINVFMDLMSQVIIDNGGTIDKYIGDSIMAFWNAPEEDSLHAYNAVKAGLEMLKRVDYFNNSFKQFDRVKIGIGINTGEMIVGNVGSTKRFDYTVLGDNVNLGARLESLTKTYGLPFIVSESVVAEVAQEAEAHRLPRFLFRQIDDVVVKGKSQPVRIFQPLENNFKNMMLKTKYEKALEKYQAGDVPASKVLFAKLKEDAAAGYLLGKL